MVGSLDSQTQDYYAKILVKYFDDPNTVFIISSDFCHWGKRLQFFLKKNSEFFLDSTTLITKKRMEKYSNRLKSSIKKRLKE